MAWDGPKEPRLRGLEGFRGARAAGLQGNRRHPTLGSGHGERGGTIGAGLEGYIANNSQWSRWRRGIALAMGLMRGGRLMSEPLLAPFRSSGALEPRSLKVTFRFPSGSSELSWLTVVRPRGSLMAPAPLAAEQLAIDTSAENPEDWRLWYQPPGNGATIEHTLRFFQHFIGEFFEDSARPKASADEAYDEQLIEADCCNKLMLAEVDLTKKRLGFRIDRWRELKPASQGAGKRRLEVTRQATRPEDVPQWRPGRVLCSSHKFSCSCPDYLGRRYGDLDGRTRDRSISNRFPLPAASRVLGAGGPQDGTTERRQVGNYAQWRTIAAFKVDAWECKHIHATRWLCGCPMAEPGDVPPGPDYAGLKQTLEAEISVLADGMQTGLLGAVQSSDAVIHRELDSGRSPDSESAALAVSTGILIEPLTDVYGNVRPFQEWGYRSMLWETGREPNPEWCRQNDWWSPTGVFDIFRFDATTNGFQTKPSRLSSRTFQAESGLRKAIVKFSEYRGPEDNPALQLQYQQSEQYRRRFKAVIVR